MSLFLSTKKTYGYHICCSIHLSAVSPSAQCLSLLINDFIICSSSNKLIIIVTTSFSLSSKCSLNTFLSLHICIVSVTAFCIIPCCFVYTIKCLKFFNTTVKRNNPNQGCFSSHTIKSWAIIAVFLILHEIWIVYFSKIFVLNMTNIPFLIIHNILLVKSHRY